MLYFFVLQGWPECCGTNFLTAGLDVNLRAHVLHFFPSLSLGAKNALEEAMDGVEVGVMGCRCNHKVTEGNFGSYLLGAGLRGEILLYFFVQGLPKWFGSNFLGADLDGTFSPYLLADGVPFSFTAGVNLFIPLDAELDNAAEVWAVGLMALLLLDEATAAAYVFFSIRAAVSSRMICSM